MMRQSLTSFLQAMRALAIFLLVLLHLSLASGRLSAKEETFPILPGLEGSIEFWKLVFTRYSLSQVVFHDAVEPSRIYKVIDVEEGPKARPIIEDQYRAVLEQQGLGEDDRRLRWQRGIRERFAEGLRKSTIYMERMQRIFEQEGLPPELAFLPLVESSFNISARSQAGALGIWQFMRSTGVQFLRIDSTVDERKDPLESTRAAARLLKRNYEVLGNWPLAVTAYNHGREGMLRAVSEVGSTDLVEIIRKYSAPTFGFASRNFYAEFIAALQIANEKERHFPNLQYHPPMTLQEWELTSALALGALLKSAGVSRDKFLEWNPALSPKIRELPKGYRVKLPTEKLSGLQSIYQKSPNSTMAKTNEKSVASAAVSWVRHRVSHGETLSDIARNYEISIRQLMKINRLSSAHRIAAGRWLRIPKR